MEAAAAVWALAGAFTAVVFCNLWLLKAAGGLIRQAQKSGEQMSQHTVDQGLRHVEQMRAAFQEEIVSARIATNGLEHFSVAAAQRVLADVAGVMEALDLTEEEAKAYLRSQIPEPESKT